MECLNPICLRNESPKWTGDCFRWVPCGKCPACIRNKRAAWNFRLQEEFKGAVNGFFITLTYDENNIPRNSLGFPTFSKADVQKFYKRLRKALEPFKIRHFTVSEYGSKNGRPHYHALLFDTPDTYDLWRVVHKCWGKGRTSVSPVNSARIGYVANYMYGYDCERDDSCDDDTNRIFMLCSKGIGKSYLTPEMVRYHKDTLVGYCRNGELKVSIPRYFCDKLFDDDERLIYNLKRKKFIEDRQVKQNERDKPVDERNLQRGIPALATMRRQKFVRNFYARKKHHYENPVNNNDLE